MNTEDDNVPQNTDAIDTKQLLAKFVDSTVAQDSDGAKVIFSDIVKTKANEIKNNLT